eukprot:3021099-Amphidinium_carterae.1
MKAHARRGFRRVYRQARLTLLFVPVGTRVHNVLKVLHSLSPTWKAEWARSSCHAPPSTAFRAAFLSSFWLWLSQSPA